MNQLSSALSGTLVLLGGEGLRSDTDQLWLRIAYLLPDAFQNVVCLPTALAGQKTGTVERRTRLIFELLAKLSGTAQIVDILSRNDAAKQSQLDLLEDASAIWCLGGEPRVLASVLRDTPAWNTIRRRHDLGVPIVASGGAATALGSIGFAPVQPYPADMDELSFKSFAGLGLLSDTVILPYLSWLSNKLIDQIVHLCPSEAQVLGLDDQAALIWDGSEWHIDGLGSIIIYSFEGKRRAIDAGQTLPTDWLSPHRKAV